MKLLYSTGSPFARKVRIVAIELGLEASLELIVVNALAETDKIISSNPLGKIPALITETGEAWFDSPVICEMLQDRVGGHAIIPESGAERLKALQLQSLADGIMDAAVSSIMEKRRPDREPSPFWLSRWSNAIDNGLDLMESECGHWTGVFAIGQISCACALGYLAFRMPELNWAGSRPALASWWDQVQERHSVKVSVPA